MDELEALEKKKLAELQQQSQEDMQNEAQLASQIEALENLAKTKLTKKALERYGNLKAAHPEKAIQLLAVLGQAIQSSNIKQITDEQLKDLLKRITPKKKEFKIKRI